MRLLALFVCLFSMQPLHALVLDMDIVSVERDGTDAMVKTADGRVLWVDASDKALLNALEEAADSDLAVTVDFDEASHRLLGLRASELNVKKDSACVEVRSTHKDANSAPFYPTIFSSQEAAQAAFNTMDNRTKDDSQCYNRAHGWSWDLWRTQQIQTMKIFMFFTNRYIREYNHNWWFHVAPMAYVASPNGAQEVVMDRSFSEFPLFVQVWTNTFLKNQPVCRSVHNYYDYNKNSSTEWCFLVRSTMYYRTTNNLQKRDRYWNSGNRSQWNTSELRSARKQAFVFAHEYDI